MLVKLVRFLNLFIKKADLVFKKTNSDKNDMKRTVHLSSGHDVTTNK